MKLKKKLMTLLCIAMTAAMLFSFAGCGSTPKTAITVDGKDYSTGEYLAYLLDNFQQAYYNGGLYYYEQNGTDVWTQEYTYNEKKVKLDEYLKQMTVDTIIRQKALENKITEAGIKYTDELTKKAQSMVDGVDEKTLLTYGVSKDSYTKMCMAYYRNEMALFLARYDKDGSSPVAETEIRKYFDENYVSYKMISVAMAESDGTAYTDAKQTETKKTLQKYLDMYNNGKAFNDVIAQYNYDTSTADNKTLTAVTDTDSLKDMDTKTASDTALAEQIKKIPEGKAQLVTYTASGTTPTAAVILRLDPEAGRSTYYADSRRSLLLAIKFDEFDKEIKEYAKTLKYTLNDRAYKMCDPKDFVASAS